MYNFTLTIFILLSLVCYYTQAETVQNTKTNKYHEPINTLQDYDFIPLLMHAFDNGKHDNKTCHACVQMFEHAKTVLKTGEIAKNIGINYCKTEKNSSESCIKLAEKMADMVVFIVQNTKITTPEMCAILLQPVCMIHLGHKITQKVNWELALPKRKTFKPTVQGNKLRMLHLTDIHLRLWYKESVGYWGNYNWDSPQNFVSNSIEYIHKTYPDIDLVVWTGDNAPHGSNGSKSNILAHNKVVADIMSKTFRGKPVYPSLGNHEGDPTDIYIPNEVSVLTNGSLSHNWLYDTLADHYWAEWLNTDSAKKTFKKGGYYSALFKPGLKIINLNSNICQRTNYWIAYEPYDPDGQVQWLIDELDAAETNGEYVVIAGHIPIPNCYLSWVNNYIRIRERYAHLIVGAFYGHTHSDEIIVYYNKDKNNQTYAVAHSYIGSSLTTYKSYNPGFRLFTLDKNGLVLDFNTYYSNMTEDNIEGKKTSPKWKSGYSAKQSYELADLSTKSWDKFLIAAKSNDNLTELYFEHFYRFSEAFVEKLVKEKRYNIGTKRSMLQNRHYVNPIYDILK